MNNFQIIDGRVGKAPEVREMPDGGKVVSFSVADRVSKKVNEEWEETTTWFNCTMFGKWAEHFVEKNPKGCKVYVDGKLKPNNYVNKEGVQVNDFELIVNRVIILSRPKSQEDQAEPAQSNEEDLPF